MNKRTECSLNETKLSSFLSPSAILEDIVGYILALRDSTVIRFPPSNFLPPLSLQNRQGDAFSSIVRIIAIAKCILMIWVPLATFFMFLSFGKRIYYAHKTINLSIL
jgi:hypothetical protein